MSGIKIVLIGREKRNRYELYVILYYLFFCVVLLFYEIFFFLFFAAIRGSPKRRMGMGDGNIRQKIGFLRNFITFDACILCALINGFLIR